jgi:hypothetical protein
MEDVLIDRERQAKGAAARKRELRITRSYKLLTLEKKSGGYPLYLAVPWLYFRLHASMTAPGEKLNQRCSCKLYIR